MRKIGLRVVVTSLFLTFALAGAALAHVEISPDTVPGGQTGTFTVEVPTEKEVPTTGVELAIPEGFEVTGVESPDGWQGEVTGGTMAWTGGEIPVAESEEFVFEGRAPEEAGEFAFDAAQTYGDGSVVNWDGAADSEDPAPMVTVQSGGPVAGGDDEPQHGDGAHGSASASASPLPESGGPGTAPVLLACAAALAVASLLLRRVLR